MLNSDPQQQSKASSEYYINPCYADLFNIIRSVISQHEHFNDFLSAVQLNKPLAHLLTSGALKRIGDEAVTTNWKIEVIKYAATMKKVAEQDKKRKKKEADGAFEIEEEEAEAFVVPTRAEAIHQEAEIHCETYCFSLIQTGDPALDRQNLLNFQIASKEINSNTATWNPENQGNRRSTFFDSAAYSNPKYAYVGGRNQYRSHIGFKYEDFEAAVDTWIIYAAPADGDKKLNVDTFTVWNVGQSKATPKIQKKIDSIRGTTSRKTGMIGLQSHIERRLYKSKTAEELPSGPEHHLTGLPGGYEESFDVYAGSLPERKPWLHTFGLPGDNFSTYEIVPLRNPLKSEPRVSMAVKRAIFPPDQDQAAGDNSIRDEEVQTIQPDEVDPKQFTPLLTYGRAAKYIENKMSMLGTSSAIVYGVGDGVIPYVCLKNKIPVLLIFGRQPGGATHKRVIQEHLVYVQIHGDPKCQKECVFFISQ